MNKIRFLTFNINKKIISILLIFILSISLVLMFHSQTMASSYNQTIINANKNNNNGIDAFPDSYKALLTKLVEQTGHTNWKFKPFYTDIDWNELTSTKAENSCYTNTVYKGNDSRWYCSATHSRDGYGGDGYYCASGKIVNYYLDPRNSLTETTIFQFLDLSNNSPLSINDIQKVVNGSFMEGYAQNGEKYANIIYDAAQASGENALSIVTKIFQEIGKGTPGNPPGMVSGKDSNYPNTYNFFNYGATDGTGAVQRGLAYADKAGWHDPRTALVEGAKLVANGYVKNGQNTKYLFKFNVVDNGKYPVFTHQYMTNIQDPTSQAKILFDKYTNNGWLNSDLTFTIPVYKNMPTFVKLPSNLTSGNLYYISSSYQSVGFRSGPGTNYSRTDIKKDTLVVMLEKNVSNANGVTWDKVQDENGKIGYVSDEYLSPVNNVKDNYAVPSQPQDENTNPAPKPEPDNNLNHYVVEGNILVTELNAKIIDLKNNGSIIKSAVRDGKNIGDNDELSTGTEIVTSFKSYKVAKLGDVNGDGKINSADLLATQKHLLGAKTITEDYRIKAADTNRDGKINSADLLKIQKYLLGVSNIEV